MTEQEARSAVVAEAVSFLKTPYHHRANVKGVGVDCAQILIEVYSAVGLIERFDPGAYPPDFMQHRNEESYLAWVLKYAHQVETPKPGDIALYKFGRCISHSGIVIEWPTIIHAHAQARCVCYGDGTQGPLGKRLAGFYSMFGDA